MSTTKNTPKTIPSIDMVWICVNDFQKAVKFYSEVVGLEVLQCIDNEHMSWAELGDPNGGTQLGITRACSHSPITAGNNAVTTFTVSDIEAAAADLKKKGAKLIGTIQEVPGHVKLQLFVDHDGNNCQLVESLS